jgi:type VI secretion system protein ImpI/type VI secretion system protein
MTLTLTMLRCPASVPPQTRTVTGGEFSIGRAPENDWALPDTERGLSKYHCVVAYRSGGWQVADLSTNGSFLNRDSEAIGRGQIRDLRDGDRLTLGPYEIEIRIAEPANRPSPAVAYNPFAADVLAATPAAPSDPRFLRSDEAPSFGADPFAIQLEPPSINLPPDFDPLAPDSEEPLLGPTQSDHSPHIADAFQAPMAHPVLPEDWDRETSPSLRPIPPPEPLVAPAMPEIPQRTAPLAQEPVPPRAPAGPAAAPPQEQLPAPDLLAAFMRGCGVGDARLADPVAAMEMLGAAFRAFVSGLRQAMIARAAVKSEFRIEQTMIRSRGNNPLKFAADDEHALTALFEDGGRTEMGAVDSVSDALRDIRLHEVATFAAMQSAVRALLEELDPAKLRRAAERGALKFVPAQRKAHAWDEFEQLYAKICRALEDDFDSVFGKAFARAYERALGDASAREPNR